MLLHYFISHIRDRVDIQVYKISKQGVTRFSQFILVKVKKIEGSSQAGALKRHSKWRSLVTKVGDMLTYQ